MSDSLLMPYVSFVIISPQDNFKYIMTTVCAVQASMTWHSYDSGFILSRAIWLCILNIYIHPFPTNTEVLFDGQSMKTAPFAPIAPVLTLVECDS